MKYSYIPKILTICIKDILGIKNKIYENFIHIDASVNWIYNARNLDGGISAGYSLNVKNNIGWKYSYPEITGYIIPTLYDYYYICNSETAREIAIKLADWLISIQMTSGGFQGHTTDFPKKEMIFDTGQILGGLLRTYKETDNIKYLKSAINAAQFLIHNQEEDGSWVKYSLNDLPHTYHTRVAWKISLLTEITNDEIYLKTATKNIKWAIKNQQENGWFKNSSFDEFSNPLVHTIAYTIRGILEVGIINSQKQYINSAKKSSDKLLNLYERNKYLAGTYDSNWNSKNKWTCLVGNAQMSIIWLKLYKIFNESKYLIAAKNMNEMIKSTQIIGSNSKEINGAIKGSHPFYGEYEPLIFPSWSAKFFIDALLQEMLIEKDYKSNKKHDAVKEFLRHQRQRN